MLCRVLMVTLEMSVNAVLLELMERRYGLTFTYNTIHQQYNSAQLYVCIVCCL